MLSDRPLLALAIAFALGILIAAHAAFPAWLLCGAAITLLAAFVILRRTRVGAAALLLLFAVFGCLRFALHAAIPADDVSHLAPRYVTVSGVVVSDVTIQAGRHRGQAASARFVLNARQAGGQRTLAPTNEAAEALGGERSLAVSGDIMVRIPLTASAEREAAGQPRPEPSRSEQTQTEQSQNEPESLETPAETASQDTSAQEDASETLSFRPHYGDTLTVWGRLEPPGAVRNPSGVDYAALLRRRGIYATLTARRAEDWRRTADASAAGISSWNDGNNPLLALAVRLRHGVLRHGQRAHDRERAGVLNGVLLGDRGDLPGALNLDFERTGTSHVLATAGLHVGIVVGLLLGFLRVFRVARRPALVLACLALIVYALMTGERPSVVRAVIMACVVLVGLLLEREPDLPNTLALAALVLLVSNPQNLFEPGFQLSFATVISLVLLMPLAESEIRSLGRRVPDHWPGAKPLRAAVETLAACFFLALCAQIGAAPLAAYYFNDVSLVSLIANTLVVPIIAVIIALGFGAASLGAIHPLLAWLPDRIVDVFLTCVINVVRACSAPDYACIYVVSPPVWLLVAYYAAVWGLACRWQRKTPRYGAERTNEPSP